MAVNNLVSIVQIYCRRLFPQTKWEISQRFKIFLMMLLECVAFCQRSVSFGLEAGARNSRKILRFLVLFHLAFGFTRCEIPTWIYFKTGVSLNMDWHTGI